MAYRNSVGQARVFVKGSNIIQGVPYVYVPPTIFDSFSYTPILGYSLRKLQNSYSGSAVRVRRTYDNEESDIGFASNGIIDVAALKSFVDIGVSLGNQDISNWDSISYTNQSIISDSLILNLNSGNSLSYSGTGNIIYSLVGTNNGSMSNISYEISNGGTLGFDGTSSNITYSSTILSQTNDFTLSTWIWIDSAPTGNKQILSWQSEDSNSLYLGLSTGSTSSNVTLNFGSTFSVILEDQYIGGWVEITAVKSSTDAIIYINGSELIKKGSSLTFTTPNNLIIGSNTNSSEYFLGRLTQVKIYNRSLTSTEVYQNYRATSATFTEDHDALTFINSVGLTNNTHKTAIHRLVRDLKSNKLWSKLRVVYPFVGGTQQSHSFNLKDPRDFDSARRIQFYGGWTHSSTGAQPNGTSGWANTFYNASVDGINVSEMHLSYYSRTNTDNTGIEIGVQSSSTVLWYLQLKNANYTYFGENNSYNRSYGAAQYRVASTSGDGNFFLQNSMSGSGRYSWVYKNGSLVNSLGMANNWPYDAAINNNVYLGAINNGVTASNFSNKEVSFASIGDSMSEVEVFKYNIIIQKYQTLLGRQIGLSYSTMNHPDGDIDLFLNNAQITNSSQQNAIEKLVRSLKYEGIWHSGMATYPFVGGTASSHRFNLNNYKFTLTFIGGWTHSSTGALPNGTNAYANPGILASQYFKTANTGNIGFYTRTDYHSAVGGYPAANFDVVATDSAYVFTGNAIGIQSRVNSRLTVHLNGTTFYGNSSIDVKESTGFNFVMRGSIAGSASTRMYIMKNDTLDYIDSAVEGISSATIPNRYFGLAGADDGTGNGWRYFSPREHSFTTIGLKDMTKIQALKYSRIIQRYQEQLNRAAIINELPYSIGDAYFKTWYNQAASGLNLIMNTIVSQPIIYKNGSIITDDNGKAAIQFDGWNDAMFTTPTINFQNAASIIAVHSGTAAGIYTSSNNTTIQSTTVGTYLPSAYTWTSNGRHNNQRMPVRAFGDNSSNASAFGMPYWSWTSGSIVSGRYSAYGLSNASLIKPPGVNISTFYLNGSTEQISNNFVVDSATSNYTISYASSAASLLIGGYLTNGTQLMSKMKYQEIMIFDKSFSISNKLKQEKNIYEFYTPFTVNNVSDIDANNLSIYNRLSATQAAVLNTLVTSMKSTLSGTVSLWDKMVAVYPVIGGNAQAHTFNLKNISLDTTEWTLSNSGVVTHDSTGMAYNGISGTSIIYKALSDTFSDNNFHMSFYLNGGTLAGSGTYPLLYSSGSNTQTGLRSTTTYKYYNNITASSSTTNGYFIATSITQNKLFRNGTLLGTASLSGTMSNGYKGTNFYGSGGVPRITVASEFAVGAFMNIKTGFMTIGYGLTDTDVTHLNRW